MRKFTKEIKEAVELQKKVNANIATEKEKTRLKNIVNWLDKSENRH
jgi:hypothetical protein